MSQSKTTFVAMSVAQIAMNNGYGFWNEESGWGSFQSATHFTAQTVLQSKLEQSSTDVQWLLFEEGQAKSAATQVVQSHPSARLLIQVRGGVVTSAHCDANLKIDVTVRDMDNIEKGDPDPLDQADLRQLATPANAIY